MTAQRHIRHFLYTVILTTAITSAAAQSVPELNRRLKKAEEQIAYIDKLLKKNSKDQRNSLQQLDLTKQKIKSRKQLIADMDAQIHLLEADLRKKQEDITGLQTSLAELKQSYEELLYQAYKNHDRRLWLMFVLSSDDVGLAYRRWRYFKNYSEYINEQALKIQQISNELNVEIQSLNTQKSELAAQRNAREKEISTLQKDEADALSITKKLAGQEKELTRRLADQRQAVQRINKQIEKIIADQAKQDQRRRKATPNLPEADRILSASFENNQGQLPWPVHKGVVTAQFGEHYHPVYKNLKLPQNFGVHISTEENSQALCVFDGVVRRVFFIPAQHNCVMVQHGEYYTIYCNLSSVNVKVNDKIARGQPLGAIFTADNTILDFQIWRMKDKPEPEKLNPELWLKK
ncbi:MAG: peptidoglycan DD-metalloendopeptidase family protein [Prevotellaceae bacterium]|nr:peptidoglycan DD-metalloendopeptidase family protein [Prevotellaceae bacterium]